MYHTGHFIDGRSVPGQGERLPVRDPATGGQLGTVAVATDAELEAAVAAARRAQAGWSAVPVQARARVLLRFRELLERDGEQLAGRITDENGKLLADARGEVARGIDVVEFACGAPRLLSGVHSPDVGGGIDAWSLRQPLGVVAGITPYNFPVMVPLWMLPLALVAGNAIVLKPSEQCPSPSLLLASLLAEAGLPAGACNVLQGGREAASALVAHPHVAGVSFVGSSAAARAVHEAAGRHGKRVQALGGAKNHLVVLPDADIAQAADAAAAAAFGSAGQRCMAVSVVVAVGDVADVLVSLLAARTRALRVAPGRSAGVDMGPLVSAAQRQRVEAAIARGVADGATLVVDGRDHPLARGPGHFLGGTLFDGVRPASWLHCEEIFGPVLCVVRAPDLDAALAIVNDHPLGNGAVCYTRSDAAARRFTRDVRAGMVGINVPIPVPLAWHSFGGWKDSLHGDHHVYGEEGLRFYTRYKSVMQRPGGDAGGAGGGFTMPVPGRTGG